MTYGAAGGFVHRRFSITWKTTRGPSGTESKSSGVTVASRASPCGAANSESALESSVEGRTNFQVRSVSWNFFHPNQIIVILIDFMLRPYLHAVFFNLRNSPGIKIKVLRKLVLAGQ